MAIALYARQSVERENSISCETQIEYCRSALKPDERDDKILTFVDNGYSGGNIILGKRIILILSLSILPNTYV